MLDAFKQFIRHHQLIAPGEKVLVAASGGIDSMVLMDLLVRSGHPVSVAHMNFGLRGAESDGDEEFLRNHCISRGIKFQNSRPDLPAFAREHRLSIQMAARQLRYEWFEQLMLHTDCRVIATAHHLDDQAETLVMQFIHGKGELTGIPVRNGKVIRPLLFTGRKEILQYATDQRVVWREDSSNAGNEYMRNQIRHQVIPVLREINPALEQAMARLHFRSEGLTELASIGLKQVRSIVCTANDEGKTIFSLSRLLEYRHPASVLHLLVRDFGFTESQCADVIEGMASGSGRKFHSPAFLMFQDRDRLLLLPLADGNRTAPSEVTVDGEGSWRLGKWRLDCSGAIAASNDPKEACLDLEKLKFPLTWRPWAPGDSFIPLGMEGHKKVSDLLVDLKVPVPDKEFVTVLSSGGELVWVAGYRISESFKVTDQTRAIFRMELIPEPLG